jgi:hypothetical protein
MSKRFIEMTSGWIPVFVLLMLAVALVNGQARAKHADSATAAKAAVVETLVSLPDDIEIVLDAALLLKDAKRGATRKERGAL